ADLARVKADLLTHHPDLRTLEGRELVVALRNIAHREIRRGLAGGNLDSIWLAYDEAIRRRTAEHSCQGVNIVFRVMLTAFGFQTRSIGLYADVEQSPGEIIESHASTDVLVNGRWQAQDATFNISLRGAK